jgi:ribonuclease HI
MRGVTSDESEVPRTAAEQLALDAISMARAGGMPEAYWLTDPRIRRACSVLGITPVEARGLPPDAYLTGLPRAVTAAVPLEVWTDGACSGNPGPGGWGWITNESEPRRGSGGDPATTNQRMEITAAVKGLESVRERPVVVVSDSTYVVNCITRKWYDGWYRNGWLNSKKEPVANRDLWEELVPLATASGVTFRWVKGHANHPLNEAADELAVAARDAARDAARP